MDKHFKLDIKINERRGESLVFSTPQTNHYQKISHLKIFPQKFNTKTDRWGNEIKIFTLNDVKQNLIILSFDYQPQTINYQTEIMEKFTLGDYKRKSHRQYFQPNQFVNGKDQRIITLAKKILKRNITLYQITQSLYLFTLDYLSYANPIEGLYRFDEALEKRKVDCGGFSTFYLSLLQAVGIPGRLVVGYLIKSNPAKDFLQLVNLSPFTFNNLLIHAWVEILLPNGCWFPADPAIEWKRNKGLTRQEGGFGIIPPNRLVVSYGCDFRLKLKNKVYNIDIYQNPKFL
jgi:transglutaminase-like putative cysteine protease